MTDRPCPTCNSTLGYYQGPNGRLRCLNCFHDTDSPTVDNPSPEPNAGGTSQAIASAKPATKAQDKAMRGPKEQIT